MQFRKSIFVLSVIALLLPNIVGAYPAVVPRTGQVSCYNASGTVIACAGTGQDGDIQAGVDWPSPRFADHGDGTVSDNLTGLVWTKNANLAGGKISWQAALDYVEGMNAGAHPNLGYTDWRLPNRRELRSLADYSRWSPALPLSYPFTNVQSDNYWSSTSVADDPLRAWAVAMYSGGDPVISYGKVAGFYIWPVRTGQCGPGSSAICLPKTGQVSCYNASGTVIACAGTGQDGDIQAGVDWPSPRFADHGDGTVSDNLTGLVWTKNANLAGGKISWQAALDYVEGMNAGAHPNLGYTDWRLPNVNELESLINFHLYNPALPLNHPFTNVQSFNNFYWSSTSVAGDTRDAWGVDMYNGKFYFNAQNKTNENYYVWPVRSGQCGSLSCSTTSTTTQPSTTTTSTNPFDAIRGTSWFFTYTCDQTYTTVLTFSDTGTSVVNEKQETGTVEYMVRYFQAVISPLEFEFSVSGNYATGRLLLNDWDNTICDLSGEKITSTSTTTISQTTTTTTTGGGATTTTTTNTSKPCPVQQVLGADNPNLENLYKLRDNTLAKSFIGRKIIQIYYNNADSINGALEQSPMLQAFTRRALEIIAPMVGGD